MSFTDFMYDGMYLSDFGCIVCTFDSNNGADIVAGSDISFNSTPVQNGRKHLLTSSTYGSTLETEFQICKNPKFAKTQKDMYFSNEEISQIRRWLNRSDFHKLELIDSDGEYLGIYFNGSFNVDAIRNTNLIIGFNLKFISDRPFAVGCNRIFNFSITIPDEKYSFIDTSDEIGSIYLDAEIKCKSNGTLRITNNKTHKTTEIKNCISGEVITIKDMLIETSNSDHSSSIMDDFNFVFPTIINDLRDRKNVYSFSLPCDVVFSYRPIRKVGII